MENSGFLGTASASAWSRWVPAFTQRLRELGWIEGHTLAIEYRWAEGREERYPKTLAEFVRLKVDVMVMGGAALPAAKRATSIIPIVFTLAGDPVRSGAVASLAGRVAMSPACRVKRPTLLEKDSSYCAKLFQVSIGSRSWQIWTIPPPYWKWTKFTPRPGR